MSEKYQYESKDVFLAKIREKYPVYNEWEDDDLYSKIIAKYPIYETQIKPNNSWWDKTKQTVTAVNKKVRDTMNKGDANLRLFSQGVHSQDEKPLSQDEKPINRGEKLREGKPQPSISSPEVKTKGTISEFIVKYAPPSENDTSNYINFVVQDLGITPDTPLIDIDTRKLAESIGLMEDSGRNPESRAMRNHNPGNLRFAKQKGATKDKDGYAVFESDEAGWQALYSQIEIDKNRNRGSQVQTLSSETPTETVENDPVEQLVQHNANRSITRHDTDRLIQLNPEQAKNILQLSKQGMSYNAIQKVIESEVNAKQNADLEKKATTPFGKAYVAVKPQKNDVIPRAYTGAYKYVKGSQTEREETPVKLDYTEEDFTRDMEIGEAETRLTKFLEKSPNIDKKVQQFEKYKAKTEKGDKLKYKGWRKDVQHTVKKQIAYEKILADAETTLDVHRDDKGGLIYHNEAEKKVITDARAVQGLAERDMAKQRTKGLYDWAEDVEYKFAVKEANKLVEDISSYQAEIEQAQNDYQKVTGQYAESQEERPERPSAISKEAVNIMAQKGILQSDEGGTFLLWDKSAGRPVMTQSEVDQWTDPKKRFNEEFHRPAHIQKTYIDEEGNLELSDEDRLDIGDYGTKEVFENAPVVGLAQEILRAERFYSIAQDPDNATEEELQSLLNYYDLMERERTRGYRVATGLTGSLWLMSSMYFTGGVYTAVKAGGKSAIKKSVTHLFKDATKNKVIKSAVKKGLLDKTGSAIGILAQSQIVGLATGSLVTRINRKTGYGNEGYAQFTDNGLKFKEFEKQADMGWTEAYIKGSLEEGAIFGIERTGGLLGLKVPKKVKGLFKGKTSPAVLSYAKKYGSRYTKRVHYGRVNHFAKKHNIPADEVWGKLRKAGYNGFGKEFGEEIQQGVLEQIFNKEDVTVPTVDELIDIGLVIAPISLFGGGALAYKKHYILRNKKKLEEIIAGKRDASEMTSKQVEDVLPLYSQEELTEMGFYDSPLAFKDKALNDKFYLNADEKHEKFITDEIQLFANSTPQERLDILEGNMGKDNVTLSDFAIAFGIEIDEENKTLTESVSFGKISKLNEGFYQTELYQAFETTYKDWKNGSEVNINLDSFSLRGKEKERVEVISGVFANQQELDITLKYLHKTSAELSSVIRLIKQELDYAKEITNNSDEIEEIEADLENAMGIKATVVDNVNLIMGQFPQGAMPDIRRDELNIFKNEAMKNVEEGLPIKALDDGVGETPKKDPKVSLEETENIPKNTTVGGTTIYTDENGKDFTEHELPNPSFTQLKNKDVILTESATIGTQEIQPKEKQEEPTAVEISPKKITGYRSKSIASLNGERRIDKVVEFETGELENTDIPETLIAQGVIKDITELGGYIEGLKEKGFTEVIWLTDTEADLKESYGKDITDAERFDIEEGIVISDLGTEGKLVAYKPVEQKPTTEQPKAEEDQVKPETGEKEYEELKAEFTSDPESLRPDLSFLPKPIANLLKQIKAGEASFVFAKENVKDHGGNLKKFFWAVNRVVNKDRDHQHYKRILDKQGFDVDLVKTADGRTITFKNGLVINAEFSDFKGAIDVSQLTLHTGEYWIKKRISEGKPKKGAETVKQPYEVGQQLLNKNNLSEKAFFNKIKVINGEQTVLVEYIFNDGGKKGEDIRYVPLKKFEQQYEAVTESKRKKLLTDYNKLNNKENEVLLGENTTQKEFVEKDKEKLYEIASIKPRKIKGWVKNEVKAKSVLSAVQYYNENKEWVQKTGESKGDFIARESKIPKSMSITTAVDYIKKYFPEIKQSKVKIRESLKELKSKGTGKMGYQSSGAYRATGESGYGSISYSKYATDDIDEWIYDNLPPESKGMSKSPKKTLKKPEVKTETKKDSPEQERKQGYRINALGQKINRQSPIKPSSKVRGNSQDLEFAPGVSPTGTMTVIEEQDLQPSHLSGNRNPKHFIGNAQPKERTGEVSNYSRDMIAKNLDPTKITDKTTDAYLGGMPSVNSRGEVIQGNNRSDALKIVWKKHPEKAGEYKQWLLDNAERLGLNKAEIEAMKSPVMVNMLDVTDEEAIKLGNYSASDLETGGIRRIDAKATVGKMTNKEIDSLASIALRSDNEGTVRSIITDNARDVLDYLIDMELITDTQQASAFNAKGNLTKDVKSDIEDLLIHSLLSGGEADLSSKFDILPDRIQKLLLQIGNKVKDTLKLDIQDAITGYANFIQGSETDFNSWLNQQDMFSNSSPKDIYSDYALSIMRLFNTSGAKGWAKDTKLKFDKYALDVKGDTGVFAKDPISKEQAFIDNIGLEKTKVKQELKDEGATDEEIIKTEENADTKRTGQIESIEEQTKTDETKEVRDSKTTDESESDRKEVRSLDVSDVKIINTGGLKGTAVYEIDILSEKGFKIYIKAKDRADLQSKIDTIPMNWTNQFGNTYGVTISMTRLQGFNDLKKDIESPYGLNQVVKNVFIQTNEIEKYNRLSSSKSKQSQNLDTKQEKADTQKSEELKKEWGRRYGGKGDIAETDRIKDFGDKIGGARKDTAKKLGKRANKKSETPAWFKPYSVGKIVGGSNKGDVDKYGLSYQIGKSYLQRDLGVFETREEAIKSALIHAVTRKHRVFKDKDGTHGIYRIASTRKWVVIKRGFENKDEANKYLIENAEDIINFRAKFPVRPHLDKLERTGENFRNGNVTPQQFSEIFGFRGIEFGNWNAQDERQMILNMAYDGLLDLANVLNVPPKALSLNGELAVGFGSRGRGGKLSASAHYEPDYGVINLTKIMGAGSLAHEWVHALDHYFGRIDEKAKPGLQGEDTKKFVTSKKFEDMAVSSGFKFRGKAREELKQALDAVMETIKYETREYTDIEIEDIKKNQQKRKQHLIESLDSSFKRLKGGLLYDETRYKKRNAKPANKLQIAKFEKITEKIRKGDVGNKINIEKKNARRFSLPYSSFDTLHELSELYKKVKGRSGYGDNGIITDIYWNIRRIQDFEVQTTDKIRGQNKKVISEYYSNAKDIDEHRASPYWSTNHELLARAFESYVFDKIEEAGNSSQYLVHSVDNHLYKLYDMKPYPEGQDREKINESLDNLFNVIKTEEKDDKVALFQLSDRTSLADIDKQIKALSNQRSSLRGKIDNLYKKEAESRQHGLFGSKADQTLLFASDEQSALINAVEILKIDIDSISDKISDLRRNRESVAEREMAKDTLPLFQLSGKPKKRLISKEKVNKEKANAREKNRKNRKSGKMLNGMVTLPYAGRTRPEAISDTKKAQQAVEKEIGEPFNTKWKLDENISDTPEYQATLSLMDIFGQKGIFIETGETESGVNFNAMTLYGKIFVNSGNQDKNHSMFFSTGHELTHRLKQDYPDLYAELYDVIYDETNNPDSVISSYAKKYTNLKGNHKAIFEEFVGDVMGDAMRDKGFWQKVYAKSPELFQNLLDLLNKIIKRLRFNASAHGIRHFIKDLERVHDVASEVMVEYAKRQNNGVGGDLALIQEAKKYDSAEEFMKAQGEPVYHGGEDIKTYGKPKFFTADKSGAEWYAGEKGTNKVNEAFVNIKNPASMEDVERAMKATGKTVQDLYDMNMGGGDLDGLYIPEVKAELIRQGFDGVESYDYLENSTIDVKIPFFDNQITTKSQLTDIWNKANKETPETVYQGKATNALSKAELKKLDSGKTIKVYRAMQVIDGKLYPPMSAKIDGKLRRPTKVGQWEKASENPELIKSDGKFKLDKANKSSIPVAYNPYFHTSTSPLNDQFLSAYKRPNLVTVEVEIPASELTSGYKADGAKDSVGEVNWTSGMVNSKLSEGKKRKVFLSRYAKVIRVVPDSEVAENIAGLLEGEGLAIPDKVITPSLKAELIKRGVSVQKTEGLFEPAQRYRGQSPEETELTQEAKKYDSAEEFIEAQEPDRNTVRLYRGLDQEFDPKTDASQTDSPVGYSTWTDNPKLAREYAGKEGYIYKIDLPKQQQGEEIVDVDGERVLFFDNEKKAGLHGVSGKEYLIYNDHELYSPNLIDELKTKPQLTDIWNKAQGKGEVDLTEEAKKYKSADEFSMSQFEAPIESLLPTEGHTAENTIGKRPSRKTDEPVTVNFNKDGKLEIEDGNHRYFEALQRGDKNIKVKFGQDSYALNFEGAKTNLTDIWNKANAQTDTLIEEAKKYKSAEEFVESKIVDKTLFNKYEFIPPGKNTPTDTKYQVFDNKTNTVVATAEIETVAKGSKEKPFLVNIRVGENYRRQGIATALYSFIEKHAGITLHPSTVKQSNKIKTYWEKKQQLTDIWNKAQGKADPLIQEAKKYGSAKEFVKGQGEPMFHGTSKDFSEFSEQFLGTNTGANSAKEGFFFTDNKDNANVYTKTIIDDSAQSISKKIMEDDRFSFRNTVVSQTILPSQATSKDIVDTSKESIIDYISKDYDRQLSEIESYVNSPKDSEQLAKLKTLKKDYIALWEKELTDNTVGKPNLKEVRLEYSNPLITKQKGTGIDKRIHAGKQSFKTYTEAIKYAKENGYDAVVIKDAIDPIKANNVIVFRESQIKTKQQLTDIWNKANKETPKTAFQTIEPNARREAKSVKLEKDKDGNLLAPNGKKSNLDEDLWKIVRTPTFKKWFGDWEKKPNKSSKVVDENGEPMVVYHGTNKGISEFKIMPSFRWGMLSDSKVYAQGHFLTPDKDIAEKFSISKNQGEGTEDYQIMELFTALKNPIDLTSNPNRIEIELSKIGVDVSKEMAIYQDSQKYQFEDLINSEEVAISDLWKLIDNKEVVEKLKDAGYDGAILDEGFPVKISYVAFNPNNIKSTSNKGTFSQTDPRINFQVQPETDTFFSQTLRVVSDKFPNKMASMSVINWMKKQQINNEQVKDEEIFWLDIKGLTEGKKIVTREELSNWIQKNEITVTDVMKRGYKVFTAKEQVEYSDLVERQLDPEIEGLSQSEYERYIELSQIKELWHSAATKHDQYQLDGQKEDYRELLLTLPRKQITIPKDLKYKIEQGSYGSKFINFNFDGETFVEPLNGRSPLESAQARINRWYNNPIRNKNIFKSPHYEEKNILAHIRFNTRYDADGNKVLFIEEFQSDWQMKGLDEGFKGQMKELTPEMKELQELNSLSWGEVLTTEQKERMRILKEKGVGKQLEGFSRIRETPPAPFISDKKGEASNEWIRLALKRMMRYGAENGFDKISWTTAKQQIDRWETNLRKNVDKIHWQRINFDSQDESSDVVKINTFKEGENTGSMTVPLEGETKIEGKKVTLDRLLGKSMANKIRASKDRTGTFEGDNSIGGGVHKYIYDNAMPSIARKLGRAFRAKVSQTELIVDKLPMPTKIVKEIKQLSNRNTELGSELERIKKDIKISLEERVEKAYPLSEELINNDDKIKELRNKYTKVFGGYTQPSIDITDKMRESVMLGQPLFQRTNFTPDTEKVQQHSTIAKMKSHTDYDRAKNHEDSLAGKRLVRDLIKKDKINSLKDALGEEVIVVGVLAEEKHGLNTIPSEMEEYVSELTGWEINEDIIQSNKVEHTGTKHIDRLFSQAEFEGNVKAGKQYVIMDDVIGSGSTLLNLKGYIENNGGIVKQVIVLGAGMFKSKMQPRAETIKTLEEKFSGNELQSVLDSIYGKGTQKEQISESEARTIRDNAGYTLNRIRKSESTSKDSEGQKAVERVQQSQSDKTSLNTPKFQKADQNRPDFINQMAEIYNELGRPNKPEFIQALKDGGWSKKHIKKASMLYTQLKEKGIVEEGVVTPLEKEITKLEEAETTAIKDIEDAKWRSDEQKEARKTRDAIHQRIKDLIAGHRIGGKEKKLELRKLKMMIRNYAKTHLPKYEITRGQIKPVLTALTNVKNERQLLAVFSRIDQIADKVYKKQLNRKILKTLKSVKMKKVSGKLIGKLTADDQDVVEQIRKIVKMTSAEAEEEKELIVSLAIKENTEPEGKQGVRWNLLELFGGLNTKSVDQLSDALLNLQSIIETGKTLRSIEEQVRKEKNKLMIKKTVKVTTGGKEVHGKMLRRTEGRDDSSMYNKVWNGLRGMNSKLQSWETLLDILSFNDKDSAPYQSFLNKKFGKDLREADLSEQEGVRLKEAILTENAERIFGAKGKALEKILNQNEEIVAMDIQVLKEIVPERFHKYKDLPKSSIKLSQNELAQYWMWMQDPKLTETFKLMGFTKETTRQIEKVLDPKVKEYAEFLLDEFYPAYYPEINTVYRQMFYVNLSNNPKYSHLSREHYGKDTDMAETLDSTSPLASAYSGHLIARVDSTKPLQPTDMLRNVYQHIFQMEHFISHAQAIRQIRAVFNSPEVRSAIEEMYGVQILQTFDRFVEDIARGGIDSKLIWKTADTAIRHFVKAKIGLKPVIFLKQLASTPANMAEIPVHAFVGGMGSFFINPKKVFNTLYDSETVQGSRLVKSRGKGYSRDVRSLLMKSTTKRLSASKGFRDYIMALAKTGDISAILMGGWSVYQYHYKQQTEAGKTEKEAHVFAIEKFDASAEKWQQSGQIKNLSEFQRGGSVMKLYTMFLNSPIQYFQQGEAGLRNLVAGRGSKTENIKRTFIAWGLMPYIFYSIGMGMFAMTPGDDDKFWKRMATAWTKGIPIVGNFIEWWALRRAWHFSLTPLTSGVEDLGRAGKAIGDLIEAELQDEELTQKQVIKMADDILDAMGTVVGFPYEGISGVAEGIAETVTGKADKPIQRSLGYSNYSLYGTNHPKSLILIKAIEHNKGEGAYLSDLRSYYKGNGKTDRYIDMQRKKDKKIYQIRKKYGFKDSRINDLLKADNEKKIKLLSRMQKTMTKQEYQNQKRALVRYKVISEDVSNMRR